MLKAKDHQKIIIFTDLDATLLESDTYSYQAASPALELIKLKSIPLIICTSKTRAEVELYRDELGLGAPFICENGGAAFIPKGYFDKLPSRLQQLGPYYLVELGKSYQYILEKLSAMKGLLGLDLKGFNDLPAEDIAIDCGLTIEMARLAKQREYDEPVLIKGFSNEELKKIVSTAARLGLKAVIGSRYMHLTGGNDKGFAVECLLDLFRLNKGSLFSVALGDSPNDLPMLARVDYPILVKMPDGSYSKEVMDSLPGVNLADEVGPRGWNNALMALLGDL